MAPMAAKRAKSRTPRMRLNFAFTKDGKRLVYRAGKAGEEQLFSVAVTNIDEGRSS
jgi:hypothetical protein